MRTILIGKERKPEHCNASLLSASTLSIEKISDRAVPFLFNHLLSMVHLSVDKTNSVPAPDDTFNAYLLEVRRIQSRYKRDE